MRNISKLNLKTFVVKAGIQSMRNRVFVAKWDVAKCFAHFSRWWYSVQNFSLSEILRGAKKFRFREGSARNACTFEIDFAERNAVSLVVERHKYYCHQGNITVISQFRRARLFVVVYEKNQMSPKITHRFFVWTRTEYCHPKNGHKINFAQVFSFCTEFQFRCAVRISQRFRGDHFASSEYRA